MTSQKKRATKTRSEWAYDFYSWFFEPEELVPGADGECAVSCPLPDHGRGRGDQHKSASINLDTGQFNCMSPTCRGGTEYDFYCQMYGLDPDDRKIFQKVMKKLEDELGERPEDADGSDDDAEHGFISMGEVEQRVYRLWHKYPRELEYLQQVRGLSKEMIGDYSIGYKPAEDRISIPIFDERGRCVNIRGYNRKGNGSKIISYGSGYGEGRLYPIENALNDDDVLLVEGEFDALLAIQYGYNAVTATLGAGNWKDEWGEYFKDKRVWICYDNDQSGQVGAERIASKLVGKASQVRIMDIGELVTDEGGDITDFFVEYDGSKEAFDELINGARVYSGLQYKEDGTIARTEHNLEILLTTGPFDNKFWKDEFSDIIMVRGSLPWRQSEGMTQWTDDDAFELRHYFGKEYGIRKVDKEMDNAIVSVANANTFHPIKEFIEREEWDGVSRLSRMFIDWLEAEDNEYVEAVTEMSMVAAVARLYKPGIKFDYMPVLVGEQGIGKSHIFSILTGGKWTSNLDVFSGKDAYEKLQESWLFEVAELEAFRKSEEREIKSFLTNTSDNFRKSYGKYVQRYPRRCVFFGTTNESEFLTDATGNRRFLPIICHREKGSAPDFERMQALVGQYWAEAKFLFDRGYELDLSPAMKEDAQEMQEQQYSADPWEDIIQEYVNRNEINEVTTQEIWFKALGGEGDKFSRMHIERIKRGISRIGWVKNKRKRTEYGQVTTYVPGAD